MSYSVEIKDVKFRWDENSDYILNIKNLDIPYKEHLFVYGKSGVGKTTLLNLISGLHSPSSGDIRVLGENFSEFSNAKKDAFRANNMGIIFQEFNLLPFLSIIENIQLPYLFIENKQYDKNKILQLLTKLDFPKSALDKPVYKLSIGQQQRVALARALISDAKIILADEPTSSLDEENRDIFLELLFELAKDSTIIYVSHDKSIAHKFKNTLSLEDLR